MMTIWKMIVTHWLLYWISYHASHTHYLSADHWLLYWIIISCQSHTLSVCRLLNTILDHIMPVTHIICLQTTEYYTGSYHASHTHYLSADHWLVYWISYHASHTHYLSADHWILYWIIPCQSHTLSVCRPLNTILDHTMPVIHIICLQTTGCTGSSYHASHTHYLSADHWLLYWIIISCQSYTLSVCRPLHHTMPVIHIICLQTTDYCTGSSYHASHTHYLSADHWLLYWIIISCQSYTLSVCRPLHHTMPVIHIICLQTTDYCTGSSYHACQSYTLSVCRPLITVLDHHIISCLPVTHIICLQTTDYLIPLL